MHDPPELRRRNPWAVFGLLVLTFGIHGAVWLRKAAPAFNARLPSRPISSRFTGTVLALCVADLAFFLVDVVFENTFRGIDSTLSGLAGGFLLLGALRIRRRIQYLAEVPGSPPPRVSLLWTVLGNVAYLQAKVNRYWQTLQTPHWAFRDRPFRDSRRLAWVACLGLPVFIGSVVLTLVLGMLAIDWIGSASFRRARHGALARFGEPTLERLSSSQPGLHPVLEIGETVELEDGEKELLKNLVTSDLSRQGVQDDLRRLRPVVERNRDTLLRIDRVVAAPGRGLGLDYSPETPISLPPSLARQFDLARLIVADGTLELVRKGPEAALPSLRRLGALAAVYEDEPPLVTLLAGSALERLHLRLLAAAVQACPGEKTARAMALTLLERPVEERLADTLAFEAAVLIRFEATESRKLAQDPTPVRPLIARRVPERAGRALLRYSLAGALDWLVLHADVYDRRYTEMRTAQLIDPDAMSRLEALRILGTTTDWTLPAKLRSVADARRGAAFALGALAEPEASCSTLGARLGSLAELYEVVDAGRSACLLRYRLREDFEAATHGELPAPPFSWRLRCG